MNTPVMMALAACALVFSHMAVGRTPAMWAQAGQGQQNTLTSPEVHAGRAGVVGNTPFEEYMLKELIPLVDAKYRTAPGRRNRAMAGLSAGGAATYNIGLKHLDVFSAFGLFSAGGLAVSDFATKYPQLAADAKARMRKSMCSGLAVAPATCSTKPPGISLLS